MNPSGVVAVYSYPISVSFLACSVLFVASHV